MMAHRQSEHRCHAWALATTLLVVAGVGAAVSAFYGAAESRDPGYDPTALAYYGLNFGQLAMIAYGVLVVSGEYTGGTIHTSLTAVPRRGLFLAGKLTAATAVALLAGLLTSIITYAVTGALMPAPASLTDPGVPRAIAGAAVYLALLALFSMAVTFVLRSPVLAMGVLMPLFFLVSPLIAEIGRAHRWRATSPTAPACSSRRAAPRRTPSAPGPAWQ